MSDWEPSWLKCGRKVADWIGFLASFWKVLAAFLRRNWPKKRR